jgi:shikimate kinase
MSDDTAQRPEAAAIKAMLGKRSLVLVGLMGAGKSTIGKRVSQMLGVPFVDADSEIGAGIPRSGEAGHSAHPANGPQGIGDRRRRIHERADAQGDFKGGHISLVEG